MVDRSTIQSVALDRLIAHRDNPNRMSSSNFAKLVRNIKQTGRYEPLIVRPYREKPRHSSRGKAAPRHCERSEAISSDSPGRDCHGPQSGPRNDNKHRASSIEDRGRFQIINGYHRWQALKQLGYKRADVIVWDVDDEQADVLLATLNRLGGSDELSKKIALLKRLSKKMNARELAKLIPQTPGQIKRLVNLRIPSAPAKIPSDKFANPLVFFVTNEQKKIIEEALSLARGLCHSFAGIRPPGSLAEGSCGLVETLSERSPRRTVIPTKVSEANEAETARRMVCTVIPSGGCEAAEVEESVRTDRHPSSFQPVVGPLRREVRIDPSSAGGGLGVTSIEHQASSLTKAEAKAETLTAVAQHFIDTILRGYDENEDQVRPA